MLKLKDFFLWGILFLSLLELSVFMLKIETVAWKYHPPRKGRNSKSFVKVRFLPSVEMT